MGTNESTPPVKNTGENKDIANGLGSRGPELDLPDDLVTELIYTSLGYGVRGSAQAQGVTTDEINRRRSSAKGYLRARNRRHMITVALQNGVIPIEVEENPSFHELTTAQDDILRLMALGWTSSEIQARLGIAESTVDTRLVRIKESFGSHNPHHTIRRAFEIGYFRLNEKILDPDELKDARDKAQDTKNGHLLVEVDELRLAAREIGLNTQNELDIVRILGGLGVGYFNGGSMIRNGFSPNSPSLHTRYNLYHVAAAKVEQKVNDAFKDTILNSHAPARNYRYYYVAKKMTIITPDYLKTIMPVNVDELPKTSSNFKPKPVNKVRVAQAKPEVEPIIESVKESLNEMDQAAVSIIESLPANESPYLDVESLPDLNLNLLKSLVPRLKSDLSDHPGAIAALNEIIYSPHLAPFDYRKKLVASLRYGIPVKEMVVINRRGKSMPLQNVMYHVPLQQGIDAASVSLVTGLKPSAVLETELAFLQKHNQQFKQLDPLIHIVSDELIDLRKKTD